MAPGVDIFSQLSPILRSAGTSVYSSGQVFVQAGSGVDFFCLDFFKGQFGVSLSVRERERELGTEFYSKNPTPNGSRPSGLIGLYKRWHQEERPQPAKRSNREEGGGDRGSTAARPTLTSR